MEAKRFGFTVTAAVAHLLDDRGKALCHEPRVLYEKDSSQGMWICANCRRQRDLSTKSPPE